MSEPNLRDDDPEIMSDDPFVRETDDEMKQAREEEAAYDRARYIALSRPVPSKPLTPTELHRAARLTSSPENPDG